MRFSLVNPLLSDSYFYFSEKDQAENLMIVDLIKNEFGRVCDTGYVHMPHLMDIQSYATIHKMVS